METIHLESSLELPATYVLSNLIVNTQPERIMKYKYVYGTFDDIYWTKMFIVPMGVRSFLFDTSFENHFKDVLYSTKVTINNRSYNKIKLLMPDLLFVVKLHPYGSNEIAQLYVQQINGPFDVNNISNLSNAPLPNLYDSGQVCQSGKISIMKMYKNKSYVLKNMFDISEYYIDMFLNSAFNNDLTSTYQYSIIKKLGFLSITDFLNIASDPKKYNILKKLYIKNHLDDHSSLRETFKASFLNNKNKGVCKSLFENNFIKSNDNDMVTRLIINNDSFINSIRINDYIKYDNEIVKVLSFGENVTNRQVFMSSSNYEEGHYIKYMTDSYRIGTIHFSEILEKVELDSIEDVDEKDYPIDIKNKFIRSYKTENLHLIVGIVKTIMNNDYFYKIKRGIDSVDFVKFNIERPRDIYKIVELGLPDVLNNECYRSKYVYGGENAHIMSIDTNKTYSFDSIKDRLIEVSNSFITMLNEDETEIEELNTNYLVKKDIYENHLNMDTSDISIIIDMDNSVIPLHDNNLKFKSDRENSLYGLDIDASLYIRENIDEYLEKLVATWNKNGEAKNIKYWDREKGNYAIMDLVLKKDQLRLPIDINDQSFCSKYSIEDFYYDNDVTSIFVNVKNLENKDEEIYGLTLIKILEFYKNNSNEPVSYFKSDIENKDNRYINKYVSINKKVQFNSVKCEISKAFKVFQIIDTDFTSSVRFNRFFTSDNIVICINKEIDPFEKIFEIREASEFTDHRNVEIIMTSSYQAYNYVPRDTYIANFLMNPRYNQVYLGI